METLSSLYQFILPYRRLLIGFSGGLDSTVLLHRLMLLRDQQSDLKLRAIHIHHGLSIHANRWVTHCRSICKMWNVPLIVKKVILQSEGLGIEGQARKVRYDVFSSTLLPHEVLVTAHHLNDQCETLLLALKRGSGPTGLSAMPNCAVFSGTKHLRPFLSTSRNSIQTWANKYNLHWIEDESNQNDRYDRNFLRLRVIPLLSKRWPHFSNAVLRSAQLCARQEILLDELLSNELTSAISKEGAIRISVLQNKSDVFREALLRRWISMHQVVMPSCDALTRIWKEVALARQDANPILRFNKFEMRRYQGKLWLVSPLPFLGNKVIFWSNPTESLMLPYGIGEVSLQPTGQIRLPMSNERVTIRFRFHGILHIIGRQGGRKLKKIWQEHNIPPWRRKVIPLLFYEETLIAAAGVFVTQEGFSKSGVQFTWKLNE